MYPNQYQPYGSMYQSPYGQPPFYNAYANLQNNQQNFQQPQQQPQNNQMQPQQAPMQSNIEYVNGIEGAKALILPPNAQKIVLDSDNPFFYIKTTDIQGKPSVRRFKYIDVDAEKGEPKQDEKSTLNFVSLDEFTELLNDFNELKNEFQKYKNTKTKKVEESEAKK